MDELLKEYIDDRHTLIASKVLISTMDKNVPFHLWDECLLGISKALAHLANTKANCQVSAFLFAEISDKIKEEQEKMRYSVQLNEVN